MKKIAITLLAAFTVSVASSCEFCDTIFILNQNTYGVYSIKNSQFYSDKSGLCLIQCKDDKWTVKVDGIPVRSYPWGCWESIPIGSFYLHNNKLKKKTQKTFGEAK